MKSVCDHVSAWNFCAKFEINEKEKITTARHCTYNTGHDNRDLNCMRKGNHFCKAGTGT